MAGAAPALGPERDRPSRRRRSRLARKAIWWLVFLAALGGAPSAIAVSKNDAGRLYSLPLAEVEQLALEWFRYTGYEVRRIPEPMGRVRLIGRREGEAAALELQPRSPLATEVQGRCEANAKADCLESLWKTLAAYAEWIPGDEARPSAMAVPEEVTAKRGAVVCVRARGDSGLVWFSGFLVDRNGLVLTTAHGFTDLRDLRVTFSNGRSVRANVFRRDVRRDLLLLETGIAGTPALSLGEGRSGVAPGEAVFTVGCPGNVIGLLHGGVADGPARHLDGLPLVPIRMEIRRGSSGSPVFDAEGRLLGMIKGRFRGTATVGFLIPLDTMMDFLRKPSP